MIRFYPETPDTGFKIIWAKNHPLTKTELTKKVSQIGPVVPEEIGYNHTNILLLYIEEYIYIIYMYISLCEMECSQVVRNILAEQRLAMRR